MKTNEWIMMTIGTSSPRVKGMNQSTLGSAGEGHGHTKGDLAEASFWTPLDSWFSSFSSLTSFVRKPVFLETTFCA